MEKWNSCSQTPTRWSLELIKVSIKVSNLLTIQVQMQRVCPVQSAEETAVSPAGSHAVSMNPVGPVQKIISNTNVSWYIYICVHTYIYIYTHIYIYAINPTNIEVICTNLANHRGISLHDWVEIAGFITGSHPVPRCSAGDGKTLENLLWHCRFDANRCAEVP